MKFVLVALSLFLVGCGETPEENRKKSAQELSKKVIIAEEASDKERQLIIKTLAYLFSTHCKGLVQYRSSIESIEVSYADDEKIKNAYEWARKRYGWSYFVELKPKIKGKPQLGISDAAGHTLYFYAGVGMLSGIYGRKDEGKEICSLPESRFLPDEMLR
ncbi:hypothetical protein RYZ26_15510 [Terasakiella sp. A23]|uniref:hypothetical protein n=1 Tax=Terasakiella sp. FCG-A23 TaxID=3080561 RepID=UPI0029551BF1|nr:hypothetical protein [Terasakiella sp. A23]MDV7341013.1 hypothetical protein [Terasakiella sp. A23]